MFSDRALPEIKDDQKEIEDKIRILSEEINRVKESITVLELETSADRVARLPPEEYPLAKYATEKLERQRLGLAAHELRIETLKKMKNNEPITKEDYDRLMRMPLFSESNIATYSNIIKSEQYEWLTPGK